MGDSIKLKGLNVALPTSSSQGSFMDPIENVFSYMGLTTPMTRLAGITIGAGVLFYFIKPGSLFRDDGDARPWALWSSDSDAILFPWWLLAMILGLLSATFV